nr:piggyBac transposable element-derived protein 4-like [Megalopta genalis]
MDFALLLPAATLNIESVDRSRYPVIPAPVRTCMGAENCPAGYGFGNSSRNLLTVAAALPSHCEIDLDAEWHPIREQGTAEEEYSEEEELLDEETDCDDPVELYKLFFTDEILEMVVEETNRYAVQRISNIASGSRRHQQAWKPVTKREMSTFIGILLIVGVVRLPEIRLYWSKKEMYGNARIKKAMKRDRFMSILKYLHFTDNTTDRIEDRLYKVRDIVDKIVRTFRNTVKPGKNIVIDESMVPWRGRLSFRQYIPGKRHKYGIKMYKLCLPGGYTYNIHIYSGKDEARCGKPHSQDVVMKLIGNLLFVRRILFTDSFYTSVPLAEELLGKDTYICGTIRMNKKFLPPQAKQKQKRGDIMSFQNRRGVKFMKWTDKRPVCMLTTSSNHKCILIRGKKDKVKPDTVFFYNDAKKGSRSV